MYNDILDAVVGRLRELFGDEYGICTEPAGQGTSGPCFFVQLQESAEKPMVGPRYFRKTEILIRYQPEETPQTFREMNRAAEILMDGLEYISLADGSLLRGTGRSVLDIAMEVGYRSSSSFNRHFLEECGCSPVEYRRRG